MTVNCEDGRLEVAFPAVEAEASRAIASLHAGLSNLGLPGQKTADIKIVLAEAINNVVEHAYAERAPGMVRVSVLDSKDYLEVQITDTGHPLPGLKMPDGIPASVETDTSNPSFPRIRKRTFGSFRIGGNRFNQHFRRQF